MYTVGKQVELVPRYAFADDEAAEGAEIYFRSSGTQVGLKYKFLKTTNGTSGLYFLIMSPQILRLMPSITPQHCMGFKEQFWA